MNEDHKDLIIKPRPTDYLMGDGNIEFKAVLSSGNWLPYIEFFERQLLVGGDSNGCVLFTAQESFDAQMEYLIQQNLIDTSVLEWFALNGYMDTGSDGQKHFHTSPRFIQILTGNKFNGNSVQDAWDVLRKSGALPYTDLPVNVPIGEYLSPIPQTLLDKASLFLAKIGGTNAIKYHWIVNNGQNVPTMAQAISHAPLCIGINVGDNWNSVTPPAPVKGSLPGHCVMNYQIVNGNAWVYDHYLPNPKELVNGYPIPYALQAVLTPIPPTPQTPTPIQPATEVTNTQWEYFFNQLSNWLSKLSLIFKGRNLTSNTMSKKFSLNVQDVSNWINNLVIFFIPVAVLYITPIPALISANGLSLADFVPNALTQGAMVLYVLNAFTDILRKYSTGTITPPVDPIPPAAG